MSGQESRYGSKRGIQQVTKGQMPLVSSTTSKEVVAILCSDLHLSEKAPLARSVEKNWFECMAKQLDELKRLAGEKNVPVLISGDIFNHWNASAHLISFALEHLPGWVFAIPGNHDLPHHALRDIKRSAFWTLVQAGRVTVVEPGQPVHTTLGGTPLRIWGFPCGYPVRSLHESHDLVLEIALVHEYLWIPNKGYTGAPDKQRLKNCGKRFAGYDVVVVGDNHQSFMVKVGKTTIYNCLLPGNWVRTEGVVAGSKAYYSGKAVELVYASGNSVRLTAKHPVLTVEGMVSADLIDEGQQVLGYVSSVNTAGMENKENGPRLIENVFSSLQKVLTNKSFRGRPTIPVDFHGDSQFFNGDVDIVAPQRELVLNGKSGKLQDVGNFEFYWGRVGAFQVASSCPGDLSTLGVFSTSSSILHGGSGLLSLFLSFTGMEFFECFRYLFRKLFFKYRVHISACKLAGFGMSSEGDASFDQNFSQSPGFSSVTMMPTTRTDAQFSGQFINRFTGQVTLDNVIKVRHFEYSGPVYDLQTETGLIVANGQKNERGIYISNCGGFYRRHADEIDHRPSVGLLHADGSVTRHYLDVSQDQFLPDDELKKKSTVGGVDVTPFVDAVDNLQHSVIDFETEVRRHVEVADILPLAKEIILEALEKCK